MRRSWAAKTPFFGFPKQLRPGPQSAPPSWETVEARKVDGIRQQTSTQPEALNMQQLQKKVSNK
ncbi:Hypothetical predicted protein [Scomber scombrus]|uniref:Uncharacterized protein n=1 Tax=Scomber scombrus TaxID=13677 RepID=A0AAV1PIS6_SCOSC